MSNHAPIILFCYNRLHVLKQTVEALKRNDIASKSELYVFIDGKRTEKDAAAVTAVSEFVSTITGFERITIIKSSFNKGLASSVIDGVDEVIKIHKKVIVLEDDLVTSTNFLSFMNQALDFYEFRESVFSISGYSIPIKGLTVNDVYFTHRASSWGWATWENRWSKVDWDVKDYNSFILDKNKQKAFNRMGSDMVSMLNRQMSNKINSWAIRWCFDQFKKQTFTVFPAVSKIQNIGFSTDDATHTKDKFNRFKTKIDTSNNTIFNFKQELKINKSIIKQFVRPYSISKRVIYKILNKL